jgi:superfamily II DNA or RNA helicase
MLKLRDWQEKAKLKCLNWYSNSSDNRFVINAAPGTGKTYGAIAIADELLSL